MKRNFLGDLLFPPKCVGCGERMSVFDGEADEMGAFCENCRAEWERDKLLECPTCRVAAVECTCTPSVLDRKHIDCISLVKFGRTESVDRLIYSLKRRKSSKNFSFASDELAKRFVTYADKEGLSASDVIFTHVPRKRATITRYGFDHAEILAKETAACVGGRYERLLVRVRDRRDQKKLGIDERAENVSGAFKLAPNTVIASDYVVLIDDVVTSGNTARECIRVLKNSGIKKAILLSIARAPEKKVAKRKHVQTKKSKKD